MAIVTPDKRVLLVVANLSKWGEPKLQRLYEWLDENAVRVAELLMKPHYRHIDALTGPEATRSNFVNRIISLAQDPQTEALDVILSLHGEKDTLYFEDGPVATSELRDELKAADLKHRLRLLYSTACYGASHARDFVKAGFRTASGAMALNTNGAYDFPAQLLHWGLGNTYRLAVSRGNNLVFLRMHDTIAKALGFDDVNSAKVIEGKKLTRITDGAV
jgi:hypothetical protein